MSDGAMVQRPNLPAAERMLERLEAFAHHTDEPGKLTRLYLGRAHRAAIDALMAWMRHAGLDPHLDAIGNVVARYEGSRPGLPALILASHIDTVRDAGKFDGNLGVLAGLAVVEEFARTGERLPFAVEVIAFGDEEGVRFPFSLSGSRALAGRFDLANLAIRDESGTSLREALIGFGLDPAGIAALARRREDVLAYVELHIEQGPVLQSENEPLGVVSSITSLARYALTASGEAGHAGTVPMRFRRDALAGAAEMVLAAEDIARQRPGLVATVGRIEARPGAVNVIPGAVHFSLDVRAAADAERRAGADAILAACAAIAARRGLTLTVSPGFEDEATPCHPAIQAGLAAAIQSLGQRPISLFSGAGHDAMAFGGLCPMGMLFLRCKDGVSHNPAEAITPEDAHLAVAALLRFLRALDPAALKNWVPAQTLRSPV